MTDAETLKELVEWLHATMIELYPEDKRYARWAAAVEGAMKDAGRYASVRNADPDVEIPVIAIHRTDSWGNWRWVVLTGDEADAAIAKDKP